MIENIGMNTKLNTKSYVCRMTSPWRYSLIEIINFVKENFIWNYILNRENASIDNINSFLTKYSTEDIDTIISDLKNEFWSVVQSTSVNLDDSFDSSFFDEDFTNNTIEWIKKMIHECIFNNSDDWTTIDSIFADQKKKLGYSWDVISWSLYTVSYNSRRLDLYFHVSWLLHPKNFWNAFTMSEYKKLTGVKLGKDLLLDQVLKQINESFKKQLKKYTVNPNGEIEWIPWFDRVSFYLNPTTSKAKEIFWGLYSLHIIIDYVENLWNDNLVTDLRFWENLDEVNQQNIFDNKKIEEIVKWLEILFEKVIKTYEECTTRFLPENFKLPQKWKYISVEEAFFHFDNYLNLEEWYNVRESYRVLQNNYLEELLLWDSDDVQEFRNYIKNKEGIVLTHLESIIEYMTEGI